MAEFTPASLDLFGGLLKGFGAYNIGQAQNAEAQFEAKQLLMNANKAKAVAQREAAEEVRQSELVQSRILAVAAASGGGASDPTVMRLIGKQAGEGAYRAALAIYKGDDRAQQLELAAKAKRYEGEMAARAGMTKAITSVAGAGMSLYDKYAQGGPATTAAEETSVFNDTGDWWGTGEFR